MPVISITRYLLPISVGLILLSAMMNKIVPAAGAQTTLDPAMRPPIQSPSQALSMPVVIHPSAQSGTYETSTRRAKDGHFYFDTVSNGVPLQMVFDTGASEVSLRAEDAAKMGIAASGLTYSIIVNTANGKAEVAPVTIATLTIGNITRRNVAALVSKPGSLHVNLLGQSFLSRLAGFKLEGEQLILQGGN